MDRCRLEAGYRVSSPYVVRKVWCEDDVDEEEMEELFGDGPLPTVRISSGED